MIVALLLAVQAPAIRTNMFESGNQLYEHCAGPQKNSALEQGICGGYITGVSDAQETIGGTIPAAHIVCVPQEVTVAQEMAIVTRYLEDHPEKRHYSAASLVLSALLVSFPCKLPSR
jgi:hypothetical protein